MRKFRLGLVAGLTLSWAGSVWAGPEGMVLASVSTHMKMSEITGEDSSQTLAKKAAKKKLADEPQDEVAKKDKMSDLNGRDQLAKAAKKKTK